MTGNEVSTPPDGSTLFPFALDADPAVALNARARAAGWAVDCDTQLAFDHEPLAAVVEVWRGLCRPNRLPARADFTFPLLKPFLRDISILDVVRNDGRRRYLHRLVGSAVVERLGELTGVFLDDFLPPAIYQKTATYFDAAIDNRCPLRIVTDFELKAVDHTRCEGVILPLGADGALPDMLFSMSHFSEKPRTA